MPFITFLSFNSGVITYTYTRVIDYQGYWLSQVVGHRDSIYWLLCLCCWGFRGSHELEALAVLCGCCRDKATLGPREVFWAGDWAVRSWLPLTSPASLGPQWPWAWRCGPLLPCSSQPQQGPQELWGGPRRGPLRLPGALWDLREGRGGSAAQDFGWWFSHFGVPRRGGCVSLRPGWSPLLTCGLRGFPLSVALVRHVGLSRQAGWLRAFVQAEQDHLWKSERPLCGGVMVSFALFHRRQEQGQDVWST